MKNSFLCTDQAPSPAFSALNPGSALNPRTLNPWTSVLIQKLGARPPYLMYGLVSVPLHLNRLERTQLFGIWRSTRWRRVKSQTRATKQEESIHGKHVRKVSQNYFKTFPVIFDTVLDIVSLQPWVKKPLFGQQILLFDVNSNPELTKIFKWTIGEYVFDSQWVVFSWH